MNNAGVLSTLSARRTVQPPLLLDERIRRGLVSCPVPEATPRAWAWKEGERAGFHGGDLHSPYEADDWLGPAFMDGVHVGQALRHFLMSMAERPTLAAAVQDWPAETAPLAPGA